MYSPHQQLFFHSAPSACKITFFPNQPHELISCFLFPSSLVTFSFREEYLAIASETKDNCVGVQVAD